MYLPLAIHYLQFFSKIRLYRAFEKEWGLHLSLSAGQTLCHPVILVQGIKHSGLFACL